MKEYLKSVPARLWSFVIFTVTVVVFWLLVVVDHARPSTPRRDLLTVEDVRNLVRSLSE